MPYAAEDADVTLRLWQHLKPRLVGEHMMGVYQATERPLVPVLRAMEARGIKVDRAVLSRLSGEFAQKMAAMEADIYAAAGESFNIASPKQLGDILFGKMGLPGARKPKPALGEPVPMCWKGWQPRGMIWRNMCSIGAAWQN